ncbi:MAG TPA: inorganic diphosphatase [Thermoanaerobaculia bacterium]|nr:inorganic diphosphatase [Thermoanaerobaculia bacterium]
MAVVKGGSTGKPVSPIQLPAWDRESELLHVVVDTAKGSPIKFKFDMAKRCYTISHVLPPGAVFPFDFGSIPGTLADDGDPLDVLVLLESPTFTGCLVLVRPIGVLEAKQTQEGRTDRNDRLIGVAEKSRLYRDARTLRDLPGKLVNEIEHFFVSYNEERGRRFVVLGRPGPRRAASLVKAGEKRFRNASSGA